MNNMEMLCSIFNESAVVDVKRAKHSTGSTNQMQQILNFITCRLNTAGPTTTNSTAITKLRGKPEAATAVVVAPDDGHEVARNMLSSI